MYRGDNPETLNSCYWCIRLLLVISVSVPTQQNWYDKTITCPQLGENRNKWKKRNERKYNCIPTALSQSVSCPWWLIYYYIVWFNISCQPLVHNWSVWKNSSYPRFATHLLDAHTIIIYFFILVTILTVSYLFFSSWFLRFVELSVIGINKLMKMCLFFFPGYWGFAYSKTNYAQYS